MVRVLFEDDLLSGTHEAFSLQSRVSEQGSPTSRTAVVRAASVEDPASRGARSTRRFASEVTVRLSAKNHFQAGVNAVRQNRLQID